MDHLQTLLPVQNQASRICLGAFRTSPKESLEVEADELPLDLRREKLALQYVLKLKSNQANPSYSCVFKPQNIEIFNKKPKVIPPLGIRIQVALKDLDVNLDVIAKYQFLKPHIGHLKM